MKYTGMPWGMWTLFVKSFREHLTSVYGYDPETARLITSKAKQKYKEIIGHLPDFEKADRFKMNIVGVLSRIHDDHSYEVVLPDER